MKLKRVFPGDVSRSGQHSVDPETLAIAAGFVGRVRTGGEAAIREIEAELDGLPASEPLVIGPKEMTRALDRTDRKVLVALEAACERIRSFAAAQRATLPEAHPGRRVGARVLGPMPGALRPGRRGRGLRGAERLLPRGRQSTLTERGKHE